MYVVEADAAVHQHRGRRVLEAELPLVVRPRRDLRVCRLEDERHTGLGHHHDHVLDLVAVDLVADRRRGAERAVHEVAGRIGLEGDPWRLPALAEVGELRLEVDPCADERMEDAEAALEHARRALSSELPEPGGQERPVRRPGWVDRLGRGAVVEVGEQPGRHAAGDSEGARRVRRPEAAETGGSGRRTEDPADRGRVEAPLVERARGRHADARHDLVPGDDRGRATRGRSSRGPRRGPARPGQRPSRRATPSPSACRRSRARGRASRWRRRHSGPAAPSPARSPTRRRRLRAPTSPCAPPWRCRARARRARSRARRGRGVSRPRRPPAARRRGRARAPRWRTARRRSYRPLLGACRGSFARPAARSRL